MSANCITVIQPCVRIEKAEWLARRSELQNKPSWDDFGESAKFMAQDSDGAWMAFESEPAAKSHVWSAMRGWCGYAREGSDRCCGEVLGDWRDTLEKRPADLSEPAVTERLTEAAQAVLAAVPALMDEKYHFAPEFKPVTVSDETVQLERPIAVAGTGNGSAADSAFLIGRVIDLLRTSVDHFSADELADLNELTGAELTKRDAAAAKLAHIDERLTERHRALEDKISSNHQLMMAKLEAMEHKVGKAQSDTRFDTTKWVIGMAIAIPSLLWAIVQIVNALNK